MNESPGNNHWLEFKLQAPRAIATASERGSRSSPKSGAQYNHMTTSAGYASSSAGPVHFGLGANATADLVEIRWPSGIVQQMRNVAGDQGRPREGASEVVPLRRLRTRGCTQGRRPSRYFVSFVAALFAAVEIADAPDAARDRFCGRCGALAASSSKLPVSADARLPEPLCRTPRPRSSTPRLRRRRELLLHRPRPLRRPQFLLRARRRRPESAATAATSRPPPPSRIEVTGIFISSKIVNVSFRL